MLGQQMVGGSRGARMGGFGGDTVIDRSRLYSTRGDIDDMLRITIELPLSAALHHIHFMTDCLKNHFDPELCTLLRHFLRSQTLINHIVKIISAHLLVCSCRELHVSNTQMSLMVTM